MKVSTVAVTEAPTSKRMMDRKPVYDAVEALDPASNQCVVVDCDDMKELRSIRNSIHGRYPNKYETSMADGEGELKLIIVPSSKA